MMVTIASAQPVRVLAYARARGAQSLAAQTALLRLYASEHDGWELVTELADCDNRQGLQRALAEARAGACDVLLVHSLSRLTRSVVEMSRILERLESSGVTMRCVTESPTSDAPTGRLTIEELAAMVAHERKLRRHAQADVPTRGDQCP